MYVIKIKKVPLGLLLKGELRVKSALCPTDRSESARRVVSTKLNEKTESSWQARKKNQGRAPNSNSTKDYHLPSYTGRNHHWIIL